MIGHDEHEPGRLFTIVTRTLLGTAALFAAFVAVVLAVQVISTLGTWAAAIPGLLIVAYHVGALIDR